MISAKNETENDIRKKVREKNRNIKTEKKSKK